ncbi:AraC family transcriptional regulator [Scleromatobacter humisilvae]|uniref:AraC family transcriptional regulator n=1 Tax=Scleromatobacter humisilvae TaxID=2897159 RepID=A0A9X2C307_9BURK|nr:AraC family transcriptional regulator [Scleromatobacter humisilvae]MCK9687499.1 AraC family transcriptional regulator [Scleromatobacter humisilvae]
MTHPPVTVAITLVHGMLSGVRRSGDSDEPYLADAGIAAELLQQASARVTAAQYIALFKSVIERRNDEALGLLSRPLRRGTFAMIARAGVAEATLHAAIRAMARAFTLVQDDIVLKPVRGASNLAGIELRLRSPATIHPEFLHMMILRVSWRLLAWLADARLPAAAFDFAYPRPDDVDTYAKVVFPALVRFDSERSAIWFDGAELARSVRRDVGSLSRFLMASPGSVIVPKREEDVTFAVRRELQRMQPPWGDLAAVANNLFMSQSTLQRRLASERTTFQVLKDELRRDIAITRLNTSAVALAALAEELGFADSTAFQRAFKTWTGSTPGVYRQGAA